MSTGCSKSKLSFSVSKSIKEPAEAYKSSSVGSI